MQQSELLKLMKEEDFYIDPLGRIVIDNPEILKMINGALGSNTLNEVLFNGGCSNAGCIE